MKAPWLAVLFVLACAGTLSLRAQESGVNPTPNINASATGKVSAKPDVAIVFMTVRSTSSLAANALEQNNKKVADIRAELTELGYKDTDVKFSGNRFGPSGGGNYYAGGQRPPGFDVYDNFCVYIQGPDLDDVTQFNKKVSLLLDELSTVGASASVATPGYPGGSSVVSFAIKDAASYEKEATAQAFDKVRPLAEEMARHMKVHITGVAGASVYNASRTSGGYPASAFDDLPYEYISSSMDAIVIQMRVDIRYTYK